jgi:hypothetical protein
MDEYGVDGMFGTLSNPTAERRLETDLSASASMPAARKGSDFPAATKPV